MQAHGRCAGTPRHAHQALCRFASAPSRPPNRQLTTFSRPSAGSRSTQPAAQQAAGHAAACQQRDSPVFEQVPGGLAEHPEVAPVLQVSAQVRHPRLLIFRQVGCGLQGRRRRGSMGHLDTLHGKARGAPRPPAARQTLSCIAAGQQQPSSPHCNGIGAAAVPASTARQTATPPATPQVSGLPTARQRQSSTAQLSTQQRRQRAPSSQPTGGGASRSELSMGPGRGPGCSSASTRARLWAGSYAKPVCWHHCVNHLLLTA